MTEVKKQYLKLIKLDEYAKSLGLTIYDITCGYIVDGKEYKLGICGFNVSPQEGVPEFKGFVECLKSSYKSMKQAD